MLICGGWACLVSTMPPAGSLRSAIATDDLRFDIATERLLDSRDLDLSDDVDWAISGQRIVRRGAAVPIAETIDRFYDIRHVLAFDAGAAGDAIRRSIYAGYAARFGANVREAWMTKRVPRALFP
jgi:hypothetical protein